MTVESIDRFVVYNELYMVIYGFTAEHSRQRVSNIRSGGQDQPIWPSNLGQLWKMGRRM